MFGFIWRSDLGLLSTTYIYFVDKIMDLDTVINIMFHNFRACHL